MNKATVDSVMAFVRAVRVAGAAQIIEPCEANIGELEIANAALRAEVERLADQAEPAPAPKKCNRCNGTGLVSDGAIYGSGGVEYENGPVLCVKDCPDCVGPQPAPAPVGEYPAKALEGVEPIGYIAWRDGKPAWSEDCVCEDAVFPRDIEDDCTSMAIYPATTVSALQARIAELESELRRVTTSPPTGSAPCARLCEHMAFQIQAKSDARRIAELEQDAVRGHPDVQPAEKGRALPSMSLPRAQTVMTTQRTPDAGKTMGEPDDFEDSDYDDDEPECPRCHGDGMDPWNDYLLTCPLCLGDAKL